MDILERFTAAKCGDPQRCEDGSRVTAHFAAVVDGSTSKRATAFTDTNAADQAVTGGRLAMQTVLAALDGLHPDADVAEAARHFTACLRDRMPPEGLTDAAWRPTCSAVVYSAARREVWLFGDCQCRFGGCTYTNPKTVDTVLTQARCDAVRYLLAHGYTEADIRRHDLGRAIIYDALRDQTNFQNDPNRCNPYRYTVLDGTEVDVATVPVLPVGDAGRLILASDGYPVVDDTLAASEAHLQRLLEADPLCINENAATKCLMAGNVSFDDRTYLSLCL